MSGYNILPIIIILHTYGIGSSTAWVIYLPRYVFVEYVYSMLGNLSRAVLSSQILSSSVVECWVVWVEQCCRVKCCRRVSSSVVEFRRVSSSIVECRRESSSAVEYFRVSSRIVECRRAVSSSKWKTTKKVKNCIVYYCLLWWSSKEWRPISLVDPFYTF